MKNKSTGQYLRNLIYDTKGFILSIIQNEQLWIFIFILIIISIFVLVCIAGPYNIWSLALYKVKECLQLFSYLASILGFGTFALNYKSFVGNNIRSNIKEANKQLLYFSNNIEDTFKDIKESTNNNYSRLVSSWEKEGYSHDIINKCTNLIRRNAKMKAIRTKKFGKQIRNIFLWGERVDRDIHEKLIDKHLIYLSEDHFIKFIGYYKPELNSLKMFTKYKGCYRLYNRWKKGENDINE